MENYKVKLRNGLGGFPTRCVGCLLALIVLFNSFSAFAIEFTDNNYPIEESDIPSVSELFTLSRQLNQNVWLGYSPTEQLYYYISWDNMQSYPTPTREPYNYIFNANTNLLVFYAQWNSTPEGSTNCRFYVYDIANGNSWSQLSTAQTYDIYGQSYIGKQLPSDFRLLAYYFPNQLYDVNTDEPIFRYRGNFNFSYMNGMSSFNNMEYVDVYDISTKFYFNSSGQLITNGGIGTPDGEVTNNGLKGWFNKLKLWLQNLGNSISNAIGNIQGWLSSLGATIGGFFTDLWNNHLSGAFTNIGNWFSSLWTNISSGLSSLGDRISNFFIDLVDDIKGLFIPDEDFFTDYKADIEEAMELHFGAVYQTVELTGDLLESVIDLFDYEGVEDVQLFFPRIRLDLIRLGLPHPNGRYLTFVDTETFYLSEYMPDLYEPITYQFLNNYSLKLYPLDTWYAFVTATLFIYLIYFLKRQLNRILSNSFNVGDE